MSLARFLNQPKPAVNSEITIFEEEGPGERPEYTPKLRITIPAYNTQQGSIGYESPKTLSKVDLSFAPERSKARLKAEGMGFIYVGEVDPVTKVWSGWTFAALQALPVTSLTDWTTPPGAKYAKQVGGLAYWEIDPKTKQRAMGAKGPKCKSKNGRNPLARCVGPQSEEDATPNRGYDPRRDDYITIGFDEKGQPLDPEFMCVFCPLGDFMRIDGKNLPPVCKDNTEFIVFLPAQKDIEGRFMPASLAVISGNASVSIALRGRKAGQSMGHIDPNRALIGLDEYTKPMTGKPHPVELQFEYEGDVPVGVSNITQKHLAYIVGFSATNDELEIAAGNNFVPFPPKVIKTLDDFNLIMTELTKPKADGGEYELDARYVVLSVKSYAFAPEGLPDVVGGLWETPVYPLEIMLVNNNAPTNAQRVPYVNVFDPLGDPTQPIYILDPITETQYAEYRAAVDRAIGEPINGVLSYKQLWMESTATNTEEVRERMQAMLNPNNGPVIQAPAAPVLSGKLSKFAEAADTPDSDD